MDLPGYGYAGGGREAGRAFEDVAEAIFGRVDALDRPALAAILLVDVRHPGLDSDRAAWQWLRQAVDAAAVVATKIDKLARGERIRALQQLESVHECPVLPVSAVTGEGLDDLWKLTDKLLMSG